MKFDVAIVGGGIAGASLAAFLGPELKTIILERESHPAYHTTGRSAAFYAETYGGPGVQPLTTASKGFFHTPPPGFAEYPLLKDRGALHVVRDGGLSALDQLEAEFRHSAVRMERLTPAQVKGFAPMLRDAWTITGIWEPDCADMDVAGLHNGFLRMARTNGTVFRADGEVTSVEHGTTGWSLVLAGGDVIEAAILVNAAGAWADGFATRAGVRPVGIRPYRRTIAQVAADPAPPRAMPVVIDAGGDWYFKPEGDRLWVSPHDEIPDVASDVQPDELDVATAIDRFERATTARVTKLDRAWAGLRSFAPDRLPVFGFDSAVPSFFWCAGQGGFGIQSAPACGMLCAALIRQQPLPEPLLAAGVDPARYSAARFTS